MPKRVLILSAAELPRALPLKEAVTAMEEAFRAPERDLQIPLRTQLTLKETGSTFFVMPALGTSLKALGTKVAGVIPHNRDSGHDPVQAYYLLLSAADGRLLALMDGNYLTSARTAATSALATRLMARDVPSRLAIFGTGTQARFHLRAIPEVRQVVQAKICGSSREKSESFASEVAPGFSFPVRAVDPADAVSDADILCTCTTSSVPVFRGADLKPGTHINAIGAYQAHARELDDRTARQARIVVDTMAGAMAEAGDILIPLASGVLLRTQIAGDLRQVVSGTVPGRTSESEITVFKSVGFALEDLLAALHAYENARKLDLGREVDL